MMDNLYKISTEGKQALLAKIAELEALLRQFEVADGVVSPVPVAKSVGVEAVRKGWITFAPENQLSQRDPRWADIDLDGVAGGRTIGEWFCLGVVYNMMARHWGITEMLPDAFHAHLRQMGGMDAEFILAHALRIAFPEQVESVAVGEGGRNWLVWNRDPQMVVKIMDWVDAGIPVPVRVDSDPSPNEAQHWVLVTGYVGDDIYAIDPIDGALIRVNIRYGKALEALFYRQKEAPIPIEPPTEERHGGMRLTPQPPADPRAWLIDVSHHQPKDLIDFAQLKAEGVTGVFVRICYGDKVDSHAGNHISRAKNAGLLVGGYHFLDARKDIESQAMLFREQLAGWALDLPPAIDVEAVPSYGIPLPTEGQVAEFAGILRQVRPHTLIYTSKRFYDQVSDNNFGCDLWLAAYTNLEPLLPRAWRDEGWTFWQFSESGEFAGYSGHLDVNRFRADFESLEEYLKVGKAVIKSVEMPPPTVQFGMNINPDLPHCDPSHTNVLKGLDWVRFRYDNVAEKVAEYDETIERNVQKGLSVLLVVDRVNAGTIAHRYAQYGDKVAYELPFGENLAEICAGIRQASPHSPMIVDAGDNLSQLAQLDSLPVDGVGVSAFGFYGSVQSPGQNAGTFNQLFRQLQTALPNVQWWLTSIGVADGQADERHVARYFEDLFEAIQENAGRCTVLMWDGWCDGMGNSGIVDNAGEKKRHLFSAFKNVRDGNGQ